MVIHITIPYHILIQRQDEIISKGVHPEIYLSSTDLDRCQDADVRRLGDALQKAGLSYTFHAPYMDLAPGGLDTKIRRVTQERFEHVLHLAALIRPAVVVFHPEYEYCRHGEVFDLWFNGSLEMWTPLVKKAEKAGVTLALENIFDEGPEVLKKLLEKINSPRCGFCFDTGHWLIFSKIGWKEWIEVLGERLVEVHLHDNKGEEDQHLPPGDGKFDFTGFFHYLRAQRLTPLYTLEVHQEEDLPRSFETVKGYLVAS
ncbi:MAG: sugar phosphate isomerase/epimerase [Deltaproteobacteria bacterium]|nr:sugar phosphate isomerase/epimerase [Deltaproteobacteria bacterium]